MIISFFFAGRVTLGAAISEIIIFFFEHFYEIIQQKNAKYQTNLMNLLTIVLVNQ